MFICNYCHKASGSGEAQKRIVTKTRVKLYDRGIGSEIVEEKAACTKCYVGAKDIPADVLDADLAKHYQAPVDDEEEYEE